ncbi:MAG: ATP-binding cassette domain-containing protein [Candidatus Brocadiia bacterium]|jgi:ABC-2 type transport system ATP-binding protein
MIQVEQLTKRYGSTTAVDGITFQVEQGEIVGFLGPNGAGKTTTMRILTCYLPATSGRVTIAGHEVFGDSLEVRRNIGYLPEGVPLYPEMRVREYLAYRARIKEVPERERRMRVEYVMDRCGVADAERKLIGSLSKGYRQRVGLADALVSDPPVLILDEPTIGLDPNQVRLVRDLIRDLGQKHTVLLSTHILPEVEMVCGRVIIIQSGKLVFQDTLANIARQSSGGGKVIVEARVGPAEAEKAAAVLKETPGVLRVLRPASPAESGAPWSVFEIDVTPGADVREEVARRMVRHGWALRELRKEQPSLEDIFVRLTTSDNR